MLAMIQYGCMHGLDLTNEALVTNVGQIQDKVLTRCLVKVCMKHRMTEGACIFFFKIAEITCCLYVMQ